MVIEHEDLAVSAINKMYQYFQTYFSEFKSELDASKDNEEEKEELMNRYDKDVRDVIFVFRWFAHAEDENFDKQIFDAFGVLSNVMTNSDLAANEAWSLCCDIIRHNIGVGITKDRALKANFDHMEKYPFKYLTVPDAYEYLVTGVYSAWAKGEKKFPDSVSAKLEELDNFLRDDQAEHFDEANAYNVFEASYLSNADDYLTKANKKKILNSLQVLGFNSYWLNEFAKLLSTLTRVGKQVKIETPKNSTPAPYKNNPSTPKIKPEKKYLTDTEYRQLRKELRTMFDEYHVVVMKDLTDEEVNRVIEIMLILEMPKQDIVRFINLVDNRRKDEDETYARIKLYGKDGLTLYNEFKDRLAYFAYLEEVRNKLDEINSYIKELPNLDDQDIYDLYVEEIASLIKDTMAILPGDYAYEIGLVQKRLLCQEN